MCLLGFRVKGLGFGVWGLGFGVWGPDHPASVRGSSCSFLQAGVPVTSRASIQVGVSQMAQIHLSQGFGFRARVWGVGLGVWF